MCRQLASVLLLLLGLSHASAGPADDLPALVQELKVEPSDAELRKQIIALAKEQKPAMPEEAKRHLGRAQGFAENISSKDDYRQVIEELKEAVADAPWVPAPYYNLGVAQEKYGDFNGAQKSFNNYLLAAPDAANAEEVRNRTYKLEALAEKAPAAPAKKPSASSLATSPDSSASPDAALGPKWEPFTGTGNYWVEDTVVNSGKNTTKETRREGKEELFGGAMVHYDETVTDQAAINGTTRTRHYYKATDQGVVEMGSRSSSLMSHMHTNSSGHSESESESNYYPPALLVPKGLAVGLKWTAKYKTRTHTNIHVSLEGTPPAFTGIDSSGEVTQENEVIGEEKVTVAAGTFSCFVIQQKMDGRVHGEAGGTAPEYDRVATSSGKTWFSPGAGFVKTESTEGGYWLLASGSKTEIPTGTVTKTLTEYHSVVPVWGLEKPRDAETDSKAKAAQKKSTNTGATATP